ncbi:MAG: hypothetical protein ACOC54_04405 [Candidatus Sumerlaeota bacterium]
MQELYGILPMVGAAVMVLGFAWSVIAAFNRKLVWGIVCLLFPIGTLVWTFMKWEFAAKPFFVMLVGIGLAWFGRYMGG